MSLEGFDVVSKRRRVVGDQVGSTVVPILTGKQRDLKAAWMGRGGCNQAGRNVNTSRRGSCRPRLGKLSIKRYLESVCRKGSGRIWVSSVKPDYPPKLLVFS